MPNPPQQPEAESFRSRLQTVFDIECETDRPTVVILASVAEQVGHLCSQADARIATLEEDNASLKEELDWQNARNSGTPTRGGYEFYINEEWTCLADVAIDQDPGFHASLMKVRHDPDDERVRVRRVIEDDALLSQIATLEREKAEAVNELAKRLEHAVKSSPKTVETGDGWYQVGEDVFDDVRRLFDFGLWEPCENVPMLYRPVNCKGGESNG